MKSYSCAAIFQVLMKSFNSAMTLTTNYHTRLAFMLLSAKQTSNYYEGNNKESRWTIRQNLETYKILYNPENAEARKHFPHVGQQTVVKTAYL